jgi:hypothetical protein
MKHHLLFSLLILLFATSCQDKSDVQDTAEKKPRVLMMEILQTFDECNPDSASCTYAKIVYPSFTDSTTWILNDFIQKSIALIAADYVQDTLPESIESLAAWFVDDYKRFRNDYPEYNFGWYLNINSEVILDDSACVSFRIDSEAYTGGAHPNSRIQYYIVRPSDGQSLGLHDIVADTIRFKSKLEKAFRADRGLDESQSLAEMGYFIEEDGFSLTNNMGLTERELLVQFNPYEIAPYALGPTTITLNRQELGDILKLR